MNFRGSGTIPENTSDKNHTELIDKIYKLGYEVGYNNHSEIGWVLREKSTLLMEAQKLFIDSPGKYYNEGKIKGKLSRENGIGGTGTTGSKNNSPVKVAATKKNDEPEEEEDSVYPLPRNELSELPKMVNKSSVTEMPSLLKGFKHSRRK